MVKTNKMESTDHQSNEISTVESKKSKSMLSRMCSPFSYIFSRVNSCVVCVSNFLTHGLKSELHLRLISGIVLGIFVLFVTMHSTVTFATMVLLLTIVIVFEWVEMISIAKEYHSDAKFAKRWKIVGVLYAFLPSACAIVIREMENGVTITVWYFLTIWATDTVAYFVGSNLGKRKLCPTISPKKTYEGLIGGVTAGAIVSMVIYLVSSTKGANSLSIHGFFMLTLGVTLLSQVGDILESALKRRFGIKDTGSIIPGHGGIMDRLDAMVLVTPFVLVVILFYGGAIF